VLGPAATADLRARNVLILALLAVCLGVSALNRRAREGHLPPECATRIEVVSQSFDQVGCAELVPEMISRAGWPSACGRATLPAGLRDGDRLEVGESCALVRGRMSGPALRLLGLPIDVNRASVEDLQALPGLGPVMAERILKARPFRTLDELREVSGIGPIRFAALRQAAEISEIREQDFGRR